MYEIGMSGDNIAFLECSSFGIAFSETSIEVSSIFVRLLRLRNDCAAFHIFSKK